MVVGDSRFRQVRRIVLRWLVPCGAARPRTALTLLVVIGAVAGAAQAQPPADGCEIPAGYYLSVDASTPESLATTLHGVIHNHTYVKYSETGETDTWDVLSHADEDPANSSNVLDVYRNVSYSKTSTGTGSLWHREHSWPQSYGFKDGTGIGKYPHTDCHALFPVKIGYNSARHDRPYSLCEPDTAGHVCEEKETDANNGQGGSPFTGYPGWSNWRSDAPGDDRHIWETWMGRRGDVARALFYLDVRYDSTPHSDGTGEPNLVLTDDLSELVSSDGPLATAYMGRLSDLILWHFQDPVSVFEARRNDVVSCYQENRNPFIDYPGWAYCAFLGMCHGDLAITKTDEVSEAAPGETLVYLLEVENGGPDDLMGAVVRDVFDPALFSLAGVAWTCLPAPGASASAYCPPVGNASDLETGVQVILGAGDRLVFNVAAPVLTSVTDPVVNTAQVDPPPGLVDPVPADNSATDTDTLLTTGSCGAPEQRTLSHLTLSTQREFEACDSITLDQVRVVLPGGDVTLRAGREIIFEDGFELETGCELRVELDPALA